mgnify:CR=1 FL=1
MNKIYFFFLFFIISNTIFSQNQNLVAFVENSSDNKPIPSVHVINLSQVIGVITDKEGKFEIPVKLNDTLYLSYLGYKSIKVRVTNDLLKFENSKIQLTELAYALEEVIVKPYELTGYLEIDAKNVVAIASGKGGVGKALTGDTAKDMNVAAKNAPGIKSAKMDNAPKADEADHADNKTTPVAKK